MLRHNALEADCLVVGAGVVGASIAQQLARAGRDVVVVDAADDIGGGCSYANAGILAPDHVGPLATPALLLEAPQQMLRRPPAVTVGLDPSLVPFLTSLMLSAAPARAKRGSERLRQLAWTSVRMHQELADAGLSPHLTKTGALNIYTTHQSPRPGLIDGDAVSELEPAVVGACAGTVEQEEWTLGPRGYIKAMLDDAARHGADLRQSTRVTKLASDGGRVVEAHTEQHIIRADHVILATGLGGIALAAQVGIRLPIRGGRGYIVDLEVPDGAPRMPVRFQHHRVVVTPILDRVRVAGALEFGDESRPKDLSRADDLLEVAARHMPVLGSAKVIERWAGDRPCSSDGLPIIGTSSALPNLHVAAGHGMWGMILAPVTADIIRDAVITGDANPTGRWLGPDRFQRRLLPGRNQS
ncbi:FAD-binding oxidoreductase [uncultured Tessaracoccus sp.]|uniref:NAD(P)/FAD-dependent oxidoreductase n=1 Tax=uncultured Tessaracoccus sp. TaxID=905023 RepID=UPI0026250BB2|nr:FAD-dependent oxidoreductase [uncultured Tessaracoccus sp.]